MFFDLYGKKDKLPIGSPKLEEKYLQLKVVRRYRLKGKTLPKPNIISSLPSYEAIPSRNLPELESKKLKDQPKTLNTVDYSAAV